MIYEVTKKKKKKKKNETDRFKKNLDREGNDEIRQKILWQEDFLQDQPNEMQVLFANLQKKPYTAASGEINIL